MRANPVAHTFRSRHACILSAAPTDSNASIGASSVVKRSSLRRWLTTRLQWTRCPLPRPVVTLTDPCRTPEQWSHVHESASKHTITRVDCPAGFWCTGNYATMDARICGDASANCPAGTTECAESDSGCVGGDDPAAPCCPELTGIFCLLCANTSQCYVPALSTPI